MSLGRFNQCDLSCGTHRVIDGDSIWPTDAHIDHDQPLGAIQPRALNTRILTPLSPEQIPAHRDTGEMNKKSISVEIN